MTVFTKPIQQMLITLAESGASKELLHAIINLYGENVQKEHMRFLFGPAVLHQSPWIDMVPTWLIQAVMPERLAIMFEEQENGKIGWQVGPAEITAAMMPATMDGPMQHEAAAVYLWASAHAAAKHYDKPLADIWRQIDGHAVTDKEVTAPGGRYFHNYQRISAEIRNKVVRVQQERERDQRRQSKALSLPPIQSTQFSLFAD